MSVADPAALTDEELAKMQANHVRSSWGGGMCLRDEMFWPCDALQLIAALRASRERHAARDAKVDQLLDINQGLASEVDRLREQNDGLYQATIILNAEVKRREQTRQEMHDPLA